MGTVCLTRSQTAKAEHTNQIETEIFICYNASPIHSHSHSHEKKNPCVTNIFPLWMSIHPNTIQLSQYPYLKCNFIMWCVCECVCSTSRFFFHSSPLMVWCWCCLKQQELLLVTIVVVQFQILIEKSFVRVRVLHSAQPLMLFVHMLMLLYLFYAIIFGKIFNVYVLKFTQSSCNKSVMTQSLRLSPKLLHWRIHVCIEMSLVGKIRRMHAYEMLSFNRYWCLKFRSGGWKAFFYSCVMPNMNFSITWNEQFTMRNTLAILHFLNSYLAQQIQSEVNVVFIYGLR